MKQKYRNKQNYRDKHKKAHSVDSNSQMLGYKDQVDTSSEHDTSRHGRNLNTTSQKHHLFTESLDNNIQGIIVDNVYEGTHNCLERR